jgi:uncharacterized membrane protein
MPFGPMQLLVIGFEGAEFTGEIAPELRRLREHDVVRLIDLLFVTKDADGRVTTMETTDLSTEESAELGAIVGALMGYGAAGEEGAEVGAIAGAAEAERIAQPLRDDVWYVADAIPPGTSAAVAVLEHRWAIGLRDAVMRAKGSALAEAWLHPSDLVSLGEKLARHELDDAARAPAAG